MRVLPSLALLFALASPVLHPTTQAATPASHADAMDLKNNIAGCYRLENGRDVRLLLVEQQLYVDLNRRYRRELIPAGRNLLASRDGKLTVRFLAEGPVEGILIQHPELPTNVRLGESSWRGQ